MDKRLLTTALLLLVCTLQGCGFKLRGDYLVPETLQTLALTSADPYSRLTRAVSERLRIGDVTLVDQPTQTVPELRLLGDKLEERTLSLFETGQVAEYELIYTVDIEVIRAHQDPLKRTIQVLRDYQDDPDLALAKSKEKALLLNEMRAEAADRIVRFLATVR